MTSDDPYNPLEKINLAKSIASAILESPVQSMASITSFAGAGVYAIYYVGSFAAYAPLRALNTTREMNAPIYVGKAIPAGGRKGGLAIDASAGRSLSGRISKHASSIASCRNLDLKDFYFRSLVVDDIWIPLGENMLIETYQPLWNRVIDGFGNNDPGARRASQYKSPWDTLHPGRPWAEKLAQNPISAEAYEQRVLDFFAGKAVPIVEDSGDPSEADE